MNSTILHQKHSDIIFTAPNRMPTQKVIDLEKYLNRVFPGKDLFIPRFNIQDIRDSLNSKYGNYTNCFAEHGKPLDFEFTKLKYYQPEVGIDGPRHNKITDPVLVVNYLAMDILFNGYHRSFYNHLLGQQAVKALYLTA
ncbi:MAG: hypothetical protein ACK5D8_00680 [Bacteroidota bacterium]